MSHDLAGPIPLPKQLLQVQVVEFNTSTSFHEQLQVISGTGVFISVHTSNLANAQFLPPGAAVFEIIQRNWVWENLDRSFQVAQTLRPYNSQTSMPQCNQMCTWSCLTAMSCCLFVIEHACTLWSW